VNDKELLEFRSNGASGPLRETYLVEGEHGENAYRQNLTLIRVRIGAKGIERLYEGTISLTLAVDSR
jgi:hypothetical protein